MLRDKFKIPFSRRSPESSVGVRTPQEYEILLDPEASLPKVKIVERNEVLSNNDKSIDFGILNTEDSKVGELLLTMPKRSKPDSTAYIFSINIEEELRGRGFGRAAYKEVIKYLAHQKVRLISSAIQSNGKYNSKSIWDWLVKMGAAHRVHEDDDGHGQYEVI